MNAKQKRFVAEYLKDLNATQAYIRSGYSEKGAAQGAERLLRNVEVAAAVTAGQGKIAAKLEITAEKVLRDLEEVREQALAAAQFAPAVRAIELCGKHIGMFVERTQNDTTVTLRDAIDRPPQETREQWLARRARELGDPIGKPLGSAD
jgi:3-methyladenine DNA glycosylase Mpg